MARNWGVANLAPGAPLGPGYSTENFALEARNDTVVALLAKVCMPHTHTHPVCAVCVVVVVGEGYLTVCGAC